VKLTMVVEWSLGSPLRFDWDGHKLVPRNPRWPSEWGLPPVNYGLIPGYFNPADEAELDALWAGREPIAAGTWLEGEVLGMIWVADQDHKIILGEPSHLPNLDFQGLWAWFESRQPHLAGALEAKEFIYTLERLRDFPAPEH